MLSTAWQLLNGSLSATPLCMGMGQISVLDKLHYYRHQATALQSNTYEKGSHDYSTLECDNIITVRTETPAESEDKQF